MLSLTICSVRQITNDAVRVESSVASSTAWRIADTTRGSTRPNAGDRRITR